MAFSLHDIEIDIFGFPYRPCRRYQEKIADYYLDGKPRFEWERLRQRRLVQGDGVQERVCGPCPLNLLASAEGCKARVEALTSFQAVVAHLRPGSLVASYASQRDVLDPEATAALATECQQLARFLEDKTWPVAQLYDGHEPRRSKDAGLRELVFIEWDGSEETFIYSNPGYSLSLCHEGLLVRDSDGAQMPERFARLWQESASVWGETIGGRVIPFIPRSDQVPAWDNRGLFTRTQIRFLEMPVLQIYADVVDTLCVFSQTAVEHLCGLAVRRA